MQQLLQQLLKDLNSNPESHLSGGRIGVLVPVFYRGDRFTEFVWHKFAHQTYSDKTLFVCRNRHAFDSIAPYSEDYRAARQRWQELQEAHPDFLRYWEQENYSGLGNKRNQMLEEALQDRYECKYIATFDDDDVYSRHYLAMAQELLASDSRIKLVKFRDLLGIQINGTPTRLEETSRYTEEDLAAELEASRAFTERISHCEASRESNRWHIHTRGGVLPSGFGFSFVMDADILRADPSLRYGECSGVRSGEEDVLYRRIEEKFGPEAIVSLPISTSWRMAAHMEGPTNISGDMAVFHFPAEHYVAIPRPLTFVSDEILQFLATYHPDVAVRRWANAVSDLRHRHPLHASLTAVQNVDRTLKLSELWQQESNWREPSWISTSPWFRPPVGLPFGGQDIPIDAHLPCQA